MLRVGRIVTVVLMLWAVGFAFYIARIEGSGIYAIFQTLMSFFQGPALAVILAGFFWRRANGTGALTGFVSGVICAVSLFAIDRWHEALGWQPLFQIGEPFLYFSVWAFVVAVAGVAVGSCFGAPPKSQAELLADPAGQTQNTQQGGTPA
jgi:SSS family solute:Na+ symporter